MRQLSGGKFGAVPVGLCLALIVGSVVLPISGRLGRTPKTLAGQLPPPPPLNNPNTLPPATSPFPPSSPLPTQPLPTLKPAPTERIYNAPSGNFGNAPSGNFGQSAGVRGYRVLVESDNPYVLQQVRFIEPGAFFQTVEGRRVIQAGIFSTEVNARERINALATQGVAARIAGGASDPGAGLRGYYAIVPGSRDNLLTLRDRAVQSGVPFSVIQLRDRPLGPHLAVGPYSKSRDAETLSNYLRQRANLDSRVFFNP